MFFFFSHVHPSLRHHQLFRFPLPLHSSVDVSVKLIRGLFIYGQLFFIYRPSSPHNQPLRFSLPFSLFSFHSFIFFFSYVQMYLFTSTLFLTLDLLSIIIFYSFSSFYSFIVHAFDNLSVELLRVLCTSALPLKVILLSVIKSYSFPCYFIFYLLIYLFIFYLWSGRTFETATGKIYNIFFYHK